MSIIYRLISGINKRSTGLISRWFNCKKIDYSQGIASSLVIGVVALIIGAIGVTSTVFLTKINQDSRQQASGGVYSGTCFYGQQTCPAGMSQEGDKLNNCGASCANSSIAICCTALPLPTSTPYLTSAPAPTSAPTSSPSQCYFGISSCPTGMITSNDCNASSCPAGSAVCCRTPATTPVDNCNYGNSYCFGSKLRVCVTDPSTGHKNYQEIDCAPGKMCADGRTACFDIAPTPTTPAGQLGQECNQLGARCCFNSINQSLFCNSGLIPNSSNTSDCRCRLVNTECAPNDKKCEGSSLYQCTAQGSWERSRICANGCSDGACILLLSDGKICSKNDDCLSGNCQAVPGSKVCAPSGQSIGVVPAGGTCGTTAYDRTCVEGYVCRNNKCEVRTLLAVGSTCANDSQCAPPAKCRMQGTITKCTVESSLGESCSTNRDCVSGLICKSGVCASAVQLSGVGSSCNEDAECESGKCGRSEYGWWECQETIRLVEAGSQCGTTEYNQQCKSPNQCINYICRVPVETTKPFDTYLAQNANILDPNAPAPTWGEALAYSGANLANSAFNITGSVINNPGQTGQAMLSGFTGHLSNLWDQGMCADPRYANTESCKNLSNFDRAVVGLNMLTLGGLEGTISMWNSTGYNAMVNTHGYAANDPRRWLDNAPATLAIVGTATSVTSPWINPMKLSGAPVSSTANWVRNSAGEMVDNFQYGGRLLPNNRVVLNYAESATNELYLEGKGMHRSYTRNYGALPSELKIHDPSSLWDFQKEIISSARNGGELARISNLKDDLRNRGVKVIFSDCAGASCRNPTFLERVGGTKAVVQVPTLETIERTYHIGGAIDGPKMQLHFLAHEGGHAYDNLYLPKLNRNAYNQSWATEIRQQTFSREYLQAIGSRYYRGPKEFLDIVQNETNLISRSLDGSIIPSTNTPNVPNVPAASTTIVPRVVSNNTDLTTVNSWADLYAWATKNRPDLVKDNGMGSILKQIRMGSLTGNSIPSELINVIPRLAK